VRIPRRHQTARQHQQRQCEDRPQLRIAARLNFQLLRISSWWNDVRSSLACRLHRYLSPIAGGARRTTRPALSTCQAMFLERLQQSLSCRLYWEQRGCGHESASIQARTCKPATRPSVQLSYSPQPPTLGIAPIWHVTTVIATTCLQWCDCPNSEHKSHSKTHLQALISRGRRVPFRNHS